MEACCQEHGQIELEHMRFYSCTWTENHKAQRGLPSDTADAACVRVRMRAADCVTLTCSAIHESSAWPHRFEQRNVC